MNSHILLSYLISLVLLFIGILLLKAAYSDPGNSVRYQWMLRITGVLPGFLGVLFGIYTYFIAGGTDGLTIMTAWLILELGSVQILNLMKRF